MRFDLAQLETLLAICEEGTFDAAARRLHLTPSAVSQRIRALEQQTGRVLVNRSTPARATSAGEPLLSLARQQRLLAAEAARLLGDEAVVDLPVAVNADSLATWFRPVLAAVAARGTAALRLQLSDQAHTQDLLRGGEVLAAVTDDPRPVQGCEVAALGTIRYRPAATPELLDRFARGRSVDWARIPLVVFNEQDRLQDVVLDRHGVPRPPTVHRVPSSADFLEAVKSGLGWGVLPEAQLEPELASGRLAPLPGGRHLDVTLHWQRWRFASPTLAELTHDVRVAAQALRRPQRATGNGARLRS
ncbi:ArgP/LysG family DNA-binding transcriptional regulator [Nocardioides sp. Bht2]|uniref:ArgP/LysG family DNA-binding transcriptional regulator n=1 Tax=Nocardioides sp. Bht2 TaxID=3392297 RepID=UPI0039B44579